MKNLLIILLILLCYVNVRAQRLKIAGSLNADTLIVNKLKAGNGNGQSLIANNSPAALVGPGLSLSGGTLSKSTGEFSTYAFNEPNSSSTSGAINISPTQKINGLNLTLSGNQISSNNWVVGGVYEIRLTASISTGFTPNSTAAAANNAWVSLSTFNGVTTDPGFGEGVSCSPVSWTNGQIYFGLPNTASEIGYFIPNSNSKTLYLALYSSNAAFTYSGAISIKRIR